MEAKLQGAVIRWLKSKGAFVLKTTPGPGVAVGTPDVIALIDGGGWVALEIKASKTARFRPLQKETISKLDGMYFCRAVYPENWADIKKELETII